MNSIDLEWSTPASRPSKPSVATDIPIREATRAEERSFQRKQPEPVEIDELAKRHGFYTVDKWGGTERRYYADFQQKSEVIRATPRRIVTHLEDAKTVSAVLDLAEMRGWGKIKINGTEAFKKEAWVQAQARGIEVVGYKASTADRQEVVRRQAPSDQADVPAKPFWKNHIDEGRKQPARREEAHAEMGM